MRDILENLHDKIENAEFLKSHRKFYQERPFTDVIFKVENQEISAHKGYFTMCPYFSRIFADRKEEYYKL